MRYHMILAVCGLLGCGGSDGITPFSAATGEGGGDEGSSQGPGGQGSGGAAGSTNSSTSSTGSCQPSTTCQSVGAECGTIQDDGCGNTVVCPNNCSAPLVCGGGGDQFKCGCAPTSCAAQGKNCGSIPDGCGGTLDCGGCTEDYEICGGTAPVDNGQGGIKDGVGVANVCGGGCIVHPTANCGPSTDMWVCNVEGPKGDFFAVCTSASGSEPSSSWCCPS